MRNNIVKPSSIPIHTGVHGKGSLRKVKHDKKQQTLLNYTTTDMSLMIGTQQKPKKNTIRFTRSISPTRAHSRAYTPSLTKPLKMMSMTERVATLHSQNTKRKQQNIPRLHNIQKNSRQLGLTWFKWTTSKKKSYRIRPSNLSNLEFGINRQFNYEDYDQTPKKIVGHHICQRSPMNKKVSLYSN